MLLLEDQLWTVGRWSRLHAIYLLNSLQNMGVEQVQGNQLAARECYLAMLAMDKQN